MLTADYSERVAQAILALLRGRAWRVLQPASYVFGPVPPIAEWPALGIMPVFHSSTELVSIQVEETFEITVVHPLVPTDAEDTVRAILAIRDDIRSTLDSEQQIGLPFMRDLRYDRATLNIGAQTERDWEIVLTVTCTALYHEA